MELLICEYSLGESQCVDSIGHIYCTMFYLYASSSMDAVSKLDCSQFRDHACYQNAIIRFIHV